MEWSADTQWTARVAAERAGWDSHIDMLRAGAAADGSLTYAQVVGVVQLPSAVAVNVVGWLIHWNISASESISSEGAGEGIDLGWWWLFYGAANAGEGQTC